MSKKIFTLILALHLAVGTGLPILNRTSVVLADCDNIPELNKKIISFVKTSINKKVGRGECWDLAAEALDKAGAKWDHDFGFGKEVNYKNECVYPGDVMQFEGVEMIYQEGNTYHRIKLPHHTALVFEVKEKGKFKVAEQNTSNTRKKVGINPIDLSTITKGTFKIFRPVND